jgi:uncharacterized membrane protein
MSLSPLLSAPPAIQVHVAAALSAVAMGAFLLRLRGGGELHRRVGWTWVALMLVVASSSFAITSSGHFSWIHGLSVVTIATALAGAALARTHRVANHRRTMMNLYWFALVVTGLFTLLPGRIMNAVVFG